MTRSALFALVGTLLLSTSSLAKPVSVTWLGNAAFEVTSPEGTKVLIDPFLQGNPTTPKEKQDIAQYKPDVILVTHSHGDHLGQTEAIAKASGAPVVGNFTFLKSLKLDEGKAMGGNVGGKFVVKDVTVHLVPAMHDSSPGGRPLGFVLEFKGSKERIYHTGDTWIFGDMKLIQEIHKPTIILLQAGGGPYNQDPATAALAIKKFFKPKAIIPMHYATFPVLASEDDVKAAFKKNKQLMIMKPGETKTFGK